MDGAQLYRACDLDLHLDDRSGPHEGQERLDLVGAVCSRALAHAALVRAVSPASSQAGFMSGAWETSASPALGVSCRRYCHTSQQPGSARRNERKKNQPHPRRPTASAEGRPEKTRPKASSEDSNANCVAVYRWSQRDITSATKAAVPMPPVTFSMTTEAASAS